MITPDNNNQSFKDLCKKYDASVIQKLYKKITGTDGKLTSKDVFPVGLVQAIYDAISGTRLDDILTHYNYLHIGYKGTDEQTRLAVPIAHRRKLLVIQYTDYENKTRLEQYIGENINDNEWQDTNNWKTPFTEGNYTVYVTNEQLGDALKEYLINIDLSSQINNILGDVLNEYLKSEIANNFMQEVINNYLDENLKDSLDEEKVRQIIEDYLDKFDVTEIVNNKAGDVINNYLKDKDEYINELIQNFINDNLSEEKLNELIINALNENLNIALNNFFNSEAGKEILGEAVEPFVEEAVGEYFEAVKKYLEDNERVIANALARHEQAITDLQNS